MDVSAPDRLAALPEARKRSLVGYYRAQPGESLRLNTNDLFLADAFFTQSRHVFLLIQSGSFGAPNATFFFRKSDGTMADFPFLEFPLDPALLSIEERERLKRSREAVAVHQTQPFDHPEPAPVSLVGSSSTQPNREPPRRSLRKAAGWLAIGVLLSAVAM